MGKQTSQNKRLTRSQNAGKVKKPAPEMQPFIMLKTKVWQKDSHGLFDYEAAEDQYVNEKQKIFPFRKKIRKNEKGVKQLEKQSRIFICRTKDFKTQAIYKNSSPNQKAHHQLLGVCQIVATRVRKGVSFKIRTALRLENLSSALQRQALKLQNKTALQVHKDKPLTTFKSQGKETQIKVFNALICPFTVTKKFYKGTSNTQGYPLRPGNIIKFGRVQYVVLQLKTDNQFVSLRNTTNLKEVSHYQGVYEVKQSNDEKQHLSRSQGYVPTCKVCLCSQETPQDVLISPCNCKGYCGLIHIQCLRQWINSKVKKQHQGMVVSYNFDRFQCEICKMPFPQAIKMGQRKIQMMCIQKPEKPYIIIESINPPTSLMSSMAYRQQQRCLHVISAGQMGPLKIGRGHMSEIRISDVSVSRAHAQIQFNNHKFLIKDTKSKFGTLVLFDEQFTLSQKHPLLIQSGRCLYQFGIEKQPMEEQNERATQSENDLIIQNSENQGNQDNQPNQNNQTDQ